MSRDLILGHTSRDWSIGRAVEAPTRETVSERLPPAPALAEEVRAEFARTATEILRQRRKNKVPEAEWQGYRQLHRRWLVLSDARRGRWREADTLVLWNLREANREFGKKIAAFSSPRPTASTPTRDLAPSPPPTSSGPLYAALGAVAALAGAGIVTMLRKNT